MAFTQSEVQFLFTAPVTRKQLLNYKLLRSQLGLLFTAVMITAFVHPSQAPWWLSILTLWITFATCRLYMTGVVLRRRSFSEHGKSGWMRQALPLLAVFGIVGALVWSVSRHWTVLTAVPDLSGVWMQVRQLAGTSPLREMLWPFQAIVRLPMASSVDDVRRALPAAAALLAFAY